MAPHSRKALHRQIGPDVAEVSWIRRKDFHLLTVGLTTYSSDDRFLVVHTRHLQVSDPGDVFERDQIDHDYVSVERESGLEELYELEWVCKIQLICLGIRGTED
ncbi:hypothetical protein J437_LFUL005928 [Ladona fulva]|uniref:Uncharacterized protein n=1 Tax=Ladona fulva TaxID=123851 RepID=A0A8K0NXM9_LADFU|nr:hypothetical protein J437_LFUL005928 [Ladona fulva]